MARTIIREISTKRVISFIGCLSNDIILKSNSRQTTREDAMNYIGAGAKEKDLRDEIKLAQIAIKREEKRIAEAKQALEILKSHGGEGEQQAGR
ncbi:MAG: hypothetical protein ABIF87_01565 [Pseudomonadota bacterium]